MKKLKTDIMMGYSSQNGDQNKTEQDNHPDLNYGYSNNNNIRSRSSLRPGGCGSERRKCLIVPAAQKCHKNVLCSKKITGKEMDIHRQNITLFRRSSFVIGILLSLMCCGSLHAKGKTKNMNFIKYPIIISKGSDNPRFPNAVCYIILLSLGNKFIR